MLSVANGALNYDPLRSIRPHSAIRVQSGVITPLCIPSFLIFVTNRLITTIGVVPMSNKNLFIIRGLPSAGKSTAAALITQNVASANDYFTDNEGNYVFDPDKLADAHQYCRDKVLNWMECGVSLIAADNTFTREWEFEEYLSLAEEFGYMAHVIVVEKYHDGKDIHNVPDWKLEQMVERFEHKMI